jgi:hypothetical protein
MLSNNNLLNNNLIKSPFIIGYQIREILKTSVCMDDEGTPMIWLNKNEKLCIKKFKNFYMYENNKSKDSFPRIINRNSFYEENNDNDDLKSNHEKNLFSETENLQTTSLN